MSLEKELEKLNEEQLVAVTTLEPSNIRVIAGPGSGKTRVISTRYAYLVGTKKTVPDRILCVTFTNKAANEMKERISNMLGGVKCSFIMTFHGFCNKLLRSEISSINWSNGYKIIDSDDDIPSILKVIYKDLGINSEHEFFKKYKPKDVVDLILGDGCKHFPRRWVNDYEKLFEFSDGRELRILRNDAERMEDKIIYGYLAEQVKGGLLDYDDLLNLAIYILKTKPHIREKWQKKFDYIQVDEFQDVSMREFELVSILSEKNNNLFVVGDGDQCIYSFRQSDVRCLLEFEKRLSVFKKKKTEIATVFLNNNYRSTPEILNASNSLIKSNLMRLDKKLVPKRGNGAQIIHFHARDIYEEGFWVANKISGLGYKFSDIAILYRNHRLAKQIEPRLRENRIPYKILSGHGFFDKKEIKDVLSILSLAVFDDDISFERVMKEFGTGIGAKRIESLREKSRDENCSMFESLKTHSSDKEFLKTNAVSLVELIQNIRANADTQKIYILIDVIMESLELKKKYEEDKEGRLSNLIAFKNDVQKYEEKAGPEKVTLMDYLNMISLMTNQDEEDDSNKVSLMTIHAAKGLEFSVVFVIGMNETIMPSSRAYSEEELEEERRIGYVALTRAKDYLFMSEAEKGERGINPPSRYFANIDQVLYKRQGYISNFLLNMTKTAAEDEMRAKERIDDSLTYEDN